ncbi:PREDICTED: proline-rich protein 5-like isoform X2 [Priapulus caudatus]|uniref:Proline-rich protein 5-like isoform X2 n=1 Tax=Priapulus caudatus TaxID=37621 RepID=A0ABM1EM52_PRICU|nr:PREDICTED: proline-rich protein 5-like isoform X2 [Priapulus caudatus]
MHVEHRKGVQHAVVGMFQAKKLTCEEMTMLCASIRNMSNSEVGPLLFEYYQNKLLMKGMVILREKIRKNEGMALIYSIGHVWNSFYKDILCNLQLLFYPIPVKGLTIRQTTLISFRDVVVLKVKLFDALLEARQEVPAAVKQMLLVLQSVHDFDTVPHENYLKLESLVGMTVKPHLGYMGLYVGQSDPLIPVGELVTLRPDKNANGAPIISGAGSQQLRPTSLPPMSLSQKSDKSKIAFRRMPSQHVLKLETLVENDDTKVRRHSFSEQSKTHFNFDTTSEF